ncbi:5169_t:CDS:1 [Cetraspora pellucida]|uniref:5169_t:CDS:1 n=1 Tax=Cetraspora pellucida TaxID=1433469 RepID=A0A9N9ALB5_9GLOM|nr:5169_t:CDS:1 [Cetraspora pellucida]
MVYNSGRTDNFSEIIYKNPPQNLTFEFVDDATTFQRGELGLSRSYLKGRLNFGRKINVSLIEFTLKGLEETHHVPFSGRIKNNYSGSYKLTEKSIKFPIERKELLEFYDFEFPLNSNLSSSFLIADREKNVNGKIYYVFRVTISEQNSGFFNTPQKESCEIFCPLSQVLPYFTTLYKNVEGKHMVSNDELLEYSFQIPEYFGLGTVISVPIQVTFLETKVKIVRIEISLKEITTYTFENCDESVKTEKRCCRFFEEPQRISNSNLEQKLTLKVPENLNISYCGTYIQIEYKLCIKFTLVGGGINIGNGDFYKEQTVIVAKINSPNNSDDSGYSNYLSNLDNLNNSDKCSNDVTTEAGHPQEE